MESYLLYAKIDNDKNFSCFDLENGCTVKNVLFCSMLENIEENRKKLQNLVDLNKDHNIRVKFQLRTTNAPRKTVFETK